MSLPLLPAAVGVVLVALLALPLAGIVLALACATLAAASLGHRRLTWTCATVAIAVLTLRVLVPLPVAIPLPTLDEWRAALARPLALLVPAPDSALLAGIVLGDRSQVPAALSRAFAVTGTTHLLAISGFNMTLVATAVSLALRGRASPVVRAVVAVSAIAMYSVLVGLAPSVLRAALMSAVGTCGVVSGRRAATANALCAAVIAMLVADPSAVGDLGLQLSALATTGLVLWQEPIAARLGGLPSMLRESVATTLAATAPTLPVIAGAFGRVSLVSLPANLICVPMFPLLMLAGAAASFGGIVSLDLARPVALLAMGAAFALRTTVEAFAALPFASVDVPASPLTGALVALAEVAVLVVTRRVRFGIPRFPRLARPPRVPLATRPVAFVLALAIAPAAVASVWPAAPATRVIALDVGQGDAYLLELGGATMLIDGGPDPSRVIDELAATLGPWRHRIDVVALTHAHTDHGAGLLAVLERYEVGVAIEPDGLGPPSPLVDLWSAAIAKANVPRRAVRAGAHLVVGDAMVTVLAPDSVPVEVPSLVLRVERGPFSALFTGDAVDDALARVLERPDALRSRVYVPPHHGAETPYAVALRSAARPEAALISVGAGNRYGHPTPATLAALSGVPTYRTDQDGTVEIDLDGNGLVVRTHANALPPPRRGPLPYPPARQ